LTVSGYLHGSLVDSEALTISDPGNGSSGTRDTFVLNDSVGRIVISPAGALAYGVDIQFQFGHACPGTGIVADAADGIWFARHIVSRAPLA
jgi:hypothetical protein